MEYDLKKSDKEENEVTWACLVSEHVDTKLEKITSNITEVEKALEDTKQQAMEEKEKELRCNNVIIYKVPEGNNDKKDESAKEDKWFCMEPFCSTLNADVQDGNVKKIFRLGKKGKASRPFLAQLRDRSTKDKIMEALYKLKEAEDKFKNISVTHDMTKQGCADCKVLLEEAKRRQNDETGEWI